MQEFWKEFYNCYEIFVAVVMFSESLDVYKIAFEIIQDIIGARKTSRESFAYGLCNV